MTAALVGLVAYCVIMGRYQRLQRDVLFESNDLCAALIYYAETHCGRIPDAPDKVLELPYVTRQEDGTIRVRSKEDSKYYRKVYNVPIRAGWESCVNWGIDITRPSMVRGATTDALGVDRLVLRPLDNSETGNSLAIGYSEELRSICDELRRACAHDLQE